nr:serine/threonine protein kinase [Ardenticatenales bacterium]
MIDQVLLNGQYRLIEKLGEGGMGEVWRAQDVVAERPVGIKRLLLHSAHDAELR